MIKEIKILQGLPTAIVQRRDLVTHYKTNQIIKVVDTLLVLKSLTTSGIIHDYTKQFPELLPACKISRKTFYDRLATLIELGFIRKDNMNLSLCSWETLGEFFDITHLNFTVVNYDLTKENQTLEYILKGLEFFETAKRIILQVQKKLLKNQEIQIAFQQHCPGQPFTMENLFKAQQESYSKGSAAYFDLHSINPDPHRKVPTIAKAHGGQCWVNMIYLKRMLKKYEVCIVEHREKIVCKYSRETDPGRKRKTATVIGSIASILKLPKGRKDKIYHTWYDRFLHQREWHLTDIILFNPNLIAYET